MFAEIDMSMSKYAVCKRPGSFVLDFLPFKRIALLLDCWVIEHSILILTRSALCKWYYVCLLLVFATLFNESHPVFPPPVSAMFIRGVLRWVNLGVESHTYSDMHSQTGIEA